MPSGQDIEFCIDACLQNLNDEHGRSVMNLSLARQTAISTAVLLPLLMSMLSPAQAAPPQAVLVGPTGKTCLTAAVTDNGNVLGACINQTPTQAWFFRPPSTFINLKPPALGSACDPHQMGVNVMVGTCKKLLGISGVVTWSINTPSGPPTELLPLILDLRTSFGAANLHGQVAGQSIGTRQTAVLWPLFGEGKPIMVSNRYDNCKVADINDEAHNGLPNVALNCGNSPRVATYNGVKYLVNTLKTPADAINCKVTAINNSDKAAGTCNYTNGPSKATFWSSFDAVPTTLASANGYATETQFFNENDLIVVKETDTTPGKIVRPRLWRQVSNQAPYVPVPSGCNLIQVEALAQAVDKTIMTCVPTDSNAPLGVYTWSPAEGLTEVLGMAGTEDNLARAISISGTLGGGYGVTPSGSAQAFQVSLPGL